MEPFDPSTNDVPYIIMGKNFKNKSELIIISFAKVISL
ncbi:hypothetical protein B4087_2366 [Bacillus cereus]|nr:hypothetical protein B4087_2366 [Bacillus cereus]